MLSERDLLEGELANELEEELEYEAEALPVPEARLVLGGNLLRLMERMHKRPAISTAEAARAVW